MFQPGCGLFAVRCPGTISEQNWEQGGEMGRAIESLAWKASDTLVMMMPVHLVMKDHEWYLESPCRAKSLHSKDYLSLPWGGNKHHILIIFCLSSLCFCFFCCWFFYVLMGLFPGQRGWLSFRQRESRIMGIWKLFWTGFKKCWRSKTKHRKPQLKDLHMCSHPLLHSCHPRISPGKAATFTCVQTHSLAHSCACICAL